MMVANDWFTVVEYLVVALALIGNVLVAHKRRAGLWLWLVSNSLACPLVFWAGLRALAVQYALFTATTIYSLYQWRVPKEERQSGELF